MKSINQSFLLVFVLAILIGCRSIKHEPADLILKNGYIYTVDGRSSIAESVAIKKGKIAFVGNNIDANKFIGSNTQIIDLDGQLMLPGFMDAHCHSISSYRYFNELNIYGLKTYKEVQDVIKKYIVEHPEAKYIKGRGWSDTSFPGNGPDKKMIDEIVDHIPVSFSSDGGHAVWVNSKTLDLAGINAHTANTVGGVVERYPGTNEPNGTLRENAASLVSFVFPSYTIENLMSGLIQYQKMANAFGITNIHDAYLDAGSDETEAFRTLENNHRLNIRVRASLYIDPQQSTEQIQLLLDERKKNTNALFQTNSAKIFMDGVIEGGTAFLKEPYKTQPDNYGKLLWNLDSLKKMCIALEKEHFQIHVHSIGDAATAVTLDAFEAAAIHNGMRDRRNSITHLQLLDKSNFKRFNKLNVIAITQPYWFIKDDYYYNIQIPFLGQERADKEYPMKSFYDAGVIVASSSDFPVTIPCNPLNAIQYGITRNKSTNNDPKETLWPEESVTLEQMIRSFTINAAYANFMEKETGSIEVGKSADLIILNKNLFKISPLEINTAKVLTTYFQGKVVYQNEEIRK